MTFVTVIYGVAMRKPGLVALAGVVVTAMLLCCFQVLPLFPVPAPALTDLEWLPDGRVYALLSSSTSEGGVELLEIDARTGERKLQPSPLVAGCAEPDLVDLSTLANSELGLAIDCYGGEHWQLVTAGGSRIASVPPGTVVSWSDRPDRGWLSYRGDGCAGIAPIASGTVGRFPSYVPADLLPWQVDGDFFGGADCERRGGATLPRERAGTLYFLAAPGARGLPMRSDARREAEWRLFALDLGDGRVRQVAGGFHQPNELVPLADLGTAVVADHNGLWLVGVATGARKLLERGLFTAAARSPDGRGVVAARHHRYAGSEIITRRLPQEVP